MAQTSKPWESIILSWQQAVLVAGFILTLGKGLNDLATLRKDIEYLKGRIDRKVNPLEEKLEKLEDEIKCNNG